MGWFGLIFSKIKQIKNSGPTFKKYFNKGLNLFNYTLDRTTKIWIYFLEGIAISIILIFFKKVLIGIDLIETGVPKNMIAGKAMIDALIAAISSIKELLIGVCGVIPALIGVLRYKATKITSATCSKSSPNEEE